MNNQIQNTTRFKMRCMSLSGTKRKTNLGGVLDATVGDSEGVDGPVQVESVLGLPERQTFSQSSFVNLDNVNSSLLKILNFFVDGQSNLVAGFVPG